MSIKWFFFLDKYKSVYYVLKYIKSKSNFWNNEQKVFFIFLFLPSKSCCKKKNKNKNTLPLFLLDQVPWWSRHTMCPITMLPFPLHVPLTLEVTCNWQIRLCVLVYVSHEIKKSWRIVICRITIGNSHKHLKRRPPQFKKSVYVPVIKCWTIHFR